MTKSLTFCLADEICRKFNINPAAVFTPAGAKTLFRQRHRKNYNKCNPLNTGICGKQKRTHGSHNSDA